MCRKIKKDLIMYLADHSTFSFPGFSILAFLEKEASSHLT